MIYSSHLYVTYDNDRRYFSVSYCYSNYFASYETKIKEKDNRPATNIAVIFQPKCMEQPSSVYPFYNYINTILQFCQCFYNFFRNTALYKFFTLLQQKTMRSQTSLTPLFLDAEKRAQLRKGRGYFRIPRARRIGGRRKGDNLATRAERVFDAFYL